MFRQFLHKAAVLLTGRVQHDLAGQIIQRMICQANPPFVARGATVKIPSIVINVASIRILTGFSKFSEKRFQRFFQS